MNKTTPAELQFGLRAVFSLFVLVAFACSIFAFNQNSRSSYPSNIERLATIHNACSVVTVSFAAYFLFSIVKRRVLHRGRLPGAPAPGHLLLMMCVAVGVLHALLTVSVWIREGSESTTHLHWQQFSQFSRPSLYYAGSLTAASALYFLAARKFRVSFPVSWMVFFVAIGGLMMATAAWNVLWLFDDGDMQWWGRESIRLHELGVTAGLVFLLVGVIDDISKRRLRDRLHWCGVFCLLVMCLNQLWVGPAAMYYVTRGIP